MCFDQRSDIVACATSRGFIVCDMTGLVLSEAHFPAGGPTCLALLADSNVVVASGDDAPAGYSSKSVILWDRYQDILMREWQVANQIDEILFRPDILIVVHGNQISFYDSRDFGLIYNTITAVLGRFSIAIGLAGVLNLVAIPSPSGEALNIVDFHDPGYILGSIPVAMSKIQCVAFDSKAELLALAVSDSKTIQLWSVVDLELICKFKRGFHGKDIADITFDRLSNYVIATTKRGRLYGFVVPAPAERTPGVIATLSPKISSEITKGIEFHCALDIDGYVLTTAGLLKHIRLDFEKGLVVSLMEKMLEI
jgi:WD40 repeat protein